MTYLRRWLQLALARFERARLHLQLLNVLVRRYKRNGNEPFFARLGNTVLYVQYWVPSVGFQASYASSPSPGFRVAQYDAADVDDIWLTPEHAGSLVTRLYTIGSLRQLGCVQDQLVVTKVTHDEEDRCLIDVVPLMKARAGGFVSSIPVLQRLGRMTALTTAPELSELLDTLTKAQ
jgi:hypothetical protein